MQSRDDILKFLSDNKSYFHYHFNLERIGIFGSFARNEQNEDSDIDILIAFKPGTSNMFDRRLELKHFIRETQISRAKRIEIC